MEFYSTCKILPSIIFIDENGNTIQKLEGKKTLEEMKQNVQQILSTHCTGPDEKLDETAGTHKGKVCCEGLSKTNINGEKICTKNNCVENSELGISFTGDPRLAKYCCDDSANRRVIANIHGFIVHCRDEIVTGEIDNSENKNEKSEIILDPVFKNKDSEIKSNPQ
jgi:hypothetical protein